MLGGENGRLISPLIEKQYDVIYGSFPTRYDEIVLVVDDKNELSDMTLYALGLKSKDEMTSILHAALNGESIDTSIERFSYEDICNMEFHIILNSDCYTLDSETGLYTDLRDTDAGMRYLYDNGLKLKVSGIIRPNPDSASAMLSGSIAYTTELTKYIIEHAGSSDAVAAQKNDPHKDIFTGLGFDENNGSLSEAEKAEKFREYLNELDSERKANAYISMMSIPTEEQVNAALQQTMSAMAMDDIKAMMAAAFIEQTGMGEAEIQGYIASMSDEEIMGYFSQMMTEQIKSQTAEKVQQQAETMSEEELDYALKQAINDCTDEQCAAYFDEVVEYSKSTYAENLKKLGCVDIDSPSSISLYASSFENKDVIVDAIANYNKNVDEFSKIKYTDFAGIMMSSVTTIINAISYVLISFVAISLIVSSIMIGVITLISVQERTKEIGILRAIGASKKNVSSMFNAETVIIGFTSGLLGVLVTYLLCIPINAIIHRLTGIGGLNAFLPAPVAVTLIIISMLLTLIAGIIPSRSAAKKDPVVALRTE